MTTWSVTIAITLMATAAAVSIMGRKRTAQASITASASGVKVPFRLISRPAQSRGWFMLSGSSVVSQSIIASAMRAATKPHHSSVVGWAPKRQDNAAKARPVASSTSG